MCFILIILLCLISGCINPSEREEDFSTIYFEPFPIDKADAAYPFSTDNTIYKPGDKFIFQVFYKDSTGIPQNVDKIELSVVPRGKQDSTYHQSNILYRYLDKGNNQVLLEGTGLVENEKNIWTHPPRQGTFKVLQLSPYPFIQKPYEVGNNYYWTFRVGEHYADPRYCTWTGSVGIKNDYTILEIIKLDTPLGQMEVMKIKGVSTSRLGSSQLMAYFSHQYGFVELRYTNIDKSSIEMKLIKVIEN